MNHIDFRSDTFTQPTQEMRDAMYNAVVGDDMVGEDPTINELEKLAAFMTGKEAAIFVPSGTFGNQVAFFSHCNRGDEVIISDDAHPVQHEAGASAIIAGVNLRTIKTEKQWFTWDEIKNYIRYEEDIHFPKTGLIEIQNTLSNGDVMPIEEMSNIYRNAKKFGIPVHLDGARLFNAAEYYDIDVKELTQYCDSVMFCLSKGLAAPVGSMVAGTKVFIDIVRRKRKIMGGAMRQAGFLAACGIISLTKMVGRLYEDHENALMLAEAFAKYNDIFDVNLKIVKTNMFFMKIKSKKNIDLIKIIARFGILTYPPEYGVYRFVTHKDITRENVEYFIRKIPKIIDLIKTT